jgi:cytochrome c biogenesis protein CcmG/thiol:disulfide interchange protein DsbE
MTSHAKLRLLAVLSSLPLIGFIFLAVILYQRIFAGDPQTLPSAMIGKPAPEFSLPPLPGSGAPAFSTKDLQSGKPMLVNIWASWCVPCRIEHPLLMELKAQGLRLAGINYKDRPEAALKFIRDSGNPYNAIGVNESGRAGIEWGVYGVPESFVVGGDGTILFKHVGPLNRAVLRETILPLLQGKKP